MVLVGRFNAENKLLKQQDSHHNEDQLGKIKKTVIILNTCTKDLICFIKKSVIAASESISENKVCIKKSFENLEDFKSTQENKVYSNIGKRKLQ